MKNYFNKMKTEDMYAIIEKEILFLNTLSFKTEEAFISTRKGIKFLTINSKNYVDNKDFVKSVYNVCLYLMDTSDKFYKYAFLKNQNEMKAFLKQNGLVTLSFDEKTMLPYGFNLSKLNINENYICLVAGLTVVPKNKLGFSVFELSNQNFVYYTFLESKRNKKKPYVSTFINDGVSLKHFVKMTGSTCFPFEFEISRKKLLIYKKILNESFNVYLLPNFPNATLDTNTHITSFNKSEYGFEDTFEKSNIGLCPYYTRFIRAWIGNDYSTKDIFFVGELQEDVFTQLNYLFECKECFKEVA